MIQWNNVETVLLDMDGTLLDLHFDNYFWLTYIPQVFAEKNQLEIEYTQQYLGEKFDKKRGSLDWYCLDYWSEQLDLPIAQLKRDIQHKISFRPLALEFLEYLKKLNKQVFLATNAHPTTLEIKVLNTQFHHHFDGLYTSHEFGAPKEQQKFWQKFQDKIGFNKTNTLFIDDSISVLNSAKQFGIGHLLGIAKPDSQKPSQTMLPFDVLDSFSQIMGET
ncbi:MAG: GMP/IMP nucleotidase [Gammaproteobacteria bacterium]|nr:GMP/IMP nucleotidase [Gammaproteobacteria bacterium]